MNLNNLAKEVTLAEGLKEAVSIAQVKEILKVVFTIMAKLSDDKILGIVNKYKFR